MKDARRLREANLLEYGYDVKEKISRLKQTIKIKFLKQLKNEVKEAMFIDDPIFAAFDIFNVNASFDLNKTVEKLPILAKFYSNEQMSTFDESNNLAKNIIESDFIPEDVIKLFFKDFKSLVQRENDNQNAEIAKFISKKELAPNKVSSYKESHPISPVSIYKKECSRADINMKL